MHDPEPVGGAWPGTPGRNDGMRRVRWRGFRRGTLSDRNLSRSPDRIQHASTLTGTANSNAPRIPPGRAGKYKLQIEISYYTHATCLNQNTHPKKNILSVECFQKCLQGVCSVFAGSLQGSAASRVHLGASWAQESHLGSLLGHLGPILGASWGILGPSSEHLGPILEHLGAS